MFRRKELVTGAKVGGVVAAIATMLYCLISLLTIIFIVSKVHINYACTVAYSQQLEGDAIGFRTCGFLGDIRPKAVMGQPVFNNFNYHYGFIISIVVCWVIFYIMFAVSIPQLLKSWNLLFRILDSMSRKETLSELQRSLIDLRNYQERQIVMVFAEILMLIFSYGTSCYTEHGKMIFDFAWAVLSKIILGRLICCCLVVGYFVEQLVAFRRLGGNVVEIPEPVKRLLENGSQAKKLEKVEKKMKLDLNLIV